MRREAALCTAVVVLACMARLADSAEIPLQAKDAELPKLTMPEEFAMVGFFQYADGSDALYVANHNAFAPQKMTLALKNTAGAPTPRTEQFDRKTGQWKQLATQDGMVSFELPPGGGELLRIAPGAKFR